MEATNDLLSMTNAPTRHNSNARVSALFRKAQRGQPMVPVSDDGLFLRVGHGIDRDANQHPMSPRQVLVVRHEDLVEFQLHAGDLRENLVIEGLSSDDFAPGSALRFSSGAQIRLTFHCEPCKRIAHLGLPLRQLLLRRGILGVVLNDGNVLPGDTVTCEAQAFEPLAAAPTGRFISFVSKVPPGQVVTYKDVVAGMGVADSYFRAIPGYLQRASDVCPVHRVVDSEGFLVPYIAEQKQRLEAEGVEFAPVANKGDTLRLPLGDTEPEDAYVVVAQQLDRVDLKRFQWCDANVYLR